ncbi:MAG: hypothetical protein PHX40_00120 [Bacilli bacterium]|nr:hypothetical protein [Bacilli bacterium]
MRNKIKSFFIEPDLHFLLGWFGIDYKKSFKNRIITSLVITILVLIFGLAFNKLYLIIFSPIIGLIYYKNQYLSIKKKKKNIATLKRRMFPSFVKKILILIRTNNIYNSLLKMVDYTDEPIKQYLIQLLKDMDNDKTVKPFIDFANNMEFIEAYQVMTMLYTFSEHSMNKKHLVSLEQMISQLYENEIDEVIESKKRLLWLYPNFTILSMLGMIFSMAIYMFISIFSEIQF